MNASTASDREEAKNKRLVLGAVAMLLVAAGVFGGLSSLQRQAVPMTREEKTAQENEQFNTKPEQLERSLSRAKILRDKWRPWAEKHASLLGAMLAAKPDGQAAMLAVWGAIPTHNLKGDRGIASRDLMPTSDRGKAVDAWDSGLGFSWWPIEKVPYNQARLAAKPEMKIHAKAKQGLMQQRLQANFSTYRDIILSDSIHPGRQRTYLWASGRITRGGLIENPDRRPGNPSLVEGPHTEIVPPYDFLQ